MHDKEMQTACAGRLARVRDMLLDGKLSFVDSQTWLVELSAQPSNDGNATYTEPSSNQGFK